MPLQPRAAWVGGAAYGSHSQSCPGRGGLRPFFWPQICPAATWGTLCPSSAQWQGEIEQLHVGPRQPCLGSRAVRGTGRVWGPTFHWGRAVPFVPLLAYCPSQEGMEGWDGDWVLGGDLCWEVAGRGVCGG